MQTEAVRELVAAADVIRTRLATLPIDWEVQWAREEADLMLTAEARLTAAVAAVKAEEKPHPFRSFYVTPARALMGPCAVAFCGQPADAPIHQKAGK
jgi:hypothetical protein